MFWEFALKTERAHPNDVLRGLRVMLENADERGMLQLMLSSAEYNSGRPSVADHLAGLAPEMFPSRWSNSGSS